MQGELSDADGAPIDNALSVTFTLYADDIGSTTLWTETQTVDFDLGAFTANLGSNETLDMAIFRDQPNVWLGIAIDGGDEMDLIRIGSAPYAGYAQYAGSAVDALARWPASAHTRGAPPSSPPGGAACSVTMTCP